MKIIFAIALAGLLYWFYVKSNKATSKEKIVEDFKNDSPIKALEENLPNLKIYPLKLSGNFEEDLIDYIHYKEGTLSKLDTDPAAKYPTGVMFTNPKTGVTSDKWHTNKGITWQTFQNLGVKLGYSPTVQNFYSMPNDVWIKIYKNGFLNPMKVTDSNLVNYYLSLWSWGSGVGGAKTLLKGFNSLVGDVNAMIKTQGEKETTKKLIGFRIMAFDRIANAQIKKVERDSSLSEKEKEKKVKQIIQTRKSWINGALNFYHHFIL